MNEELYNHGLITNEVPPNLATEWVRNVEWLAMPTVLPTERKVVVLHRIDPGAGNFVAFNVVVTGGYTVDWGDGTSVNYASTASSYKQYDFDVVSGTPTSEGYKQVLITITPQIPANTVTFINFQQKHNLAGLSNYPQAFQDIIISLPGITGITLGSSGTSTHAYAYLERVQLIASALTSYNALFGDMIRLQSASVASSATITNTGYMFSNCVKLQSAPFVDLTAVTTATYMFAKCRYLKSLPYASITTAITNATSMFQYCDSLAAVPQITFTAASVNCTQMFQYCTNLIVAPVINWVKVNNLSNAFAYCARLTKFGGVNLPLCTTINSMFAYSGMVSPGDFTTSTLLTQADSMFYRCERLERAPEISNTVNVNTMAGMYYYCYNIKSCPVYDTANVTSMSNMFANCYSLEAAPAFNTIKVTTFSGMFANCVALSTIPMYDYQKATTISTMFNNCVGLKSIGAFNFGTTTTSGIICTSAFSCSNAFDGALEEIGTFTIPATAASVSYGSMFVNNRNLKSVNLDCAKVIATAGIGSVLSGAVNIRSVILTGLRFGAFTIGGMMDAPALVALFTSLGTATGSQTITVSGNWGWASLTAADKLIATSKGWTLA